MPISIQLAQQQSYGAAGTIMGNPRQIGVQSLAFTSGQTLTVRSAASGQSTTTATSTPNANPAGIFKVELSANDVLEDTADGGTTFRTLAAAGAIVPFFVTDGYNVRIRNTGVADSGAVLTRLTQIDMAF